MRCLLFFVWHWLSRLLHDPWLKVTHFGWVSSAAMACTLVLGLLSPACQAADKPSRPNIIFIMADDLGAAELGCYGQQKIKTPHIDQLAAEGIRFTNHYTSAPVCAGTLQPDDWQTWRACPGARQFREPSGRLFV